MRPPPRKGPPRGAGRQDSELAASSPRTRATCMFSRPLFNLPCYVPAKPSPWLTCTTWGFLGRPGLRRGLHFLQFHCAVHGPHHFSNIGNAAFATPELPFGQAGDGWGSSKGETGSYRAPPSGTRIRVGWIWSYSNHFTSKVCPVDRLAGQRQPGKKGFEQQSYRSCPEKTDLDFSSRQVRSPPYDPKRREMFQSPRGVRGGDSQPIQGAGAPLRATTSLEWRGPNVEPARLSKATDDHAPSSPFHFNVRTAALHGEAPSIEFKEEPGHSPGPLRYQTSLKMRT